MSSNPCEICGCTDLNLVDGFYYCVECGTQDLNVRETMVQAPVLADGTYALSDTKRYTTTVLQDAVQMSGEWHKWHAFNFILVSLTDELIALGAKPTIKMKVLWIWVRYIKKFQQKEEPEATQFENKEDKEESNHEDTDEENIDEIDEYECDKTKKTKRKHSGIPQYNITYITKAVILSILYVALNLDKSHIQLSHLYQFIREGRFSLYNCTKFVPKEISVKLIPNWCKFSIFRPEYSVRSIRICAMNIFKQLDLGVPIVPDLNKIISNYITELCLPNDFKDLVLSLIRLMPCDILEMDDKLKKYPRHTPINTPDYETICMSYVLLALKMCFGLDCDYEVRLSDAVDKINSEEDYLKSYKLGMYSEPSDRLFSFREWYMFIQLRKMMLSKHYLPVARQFNFSADDSVFMEHLDERTKRKIRISDEVTMNILKNIPIDETRVIPKKEFPVTVTPMTTYTEVILNYISNPDFKLRLCEDFTQYSLKYATKDLKLPGYDISSANLIKGVDAANKIIKPRVVGMLQPKTGDQTIVLVRNCENKNWLKTKPPRVKHITKENSDKSDYGYDSSSDRISEHDDDSHEDTGDVIEEEDEELSIFDDNFMDLQIQEDEKKHLTHIEETNVFEFHNNNLFDSKTDIYDTFSELSAQDMVYNPETFDREKVIQELIEIACKKYKIPLPKENKRANKRKIFENNESGVSKPKIKRNNINKLKPGEAVKLKQELINAYYDNINNDVLLKVLENVRTAIRINQTEEIYPQHEEDNDENLVDVNVENVRGDNDENLRDDNDLNTSAHNSRVEDVIINGTIDDSDGENNIEKLLPKHDPKFDPKTHDINQLYVNVKEELDLGDIVNIDINDPDICNIIDKKLTEFRDFDENDHQNDKGSVNDKSNDSNDSDDDIVLSDLKLSNMRRKDKAKLKHLVDKKNIKKFNYWIKYYTTKVFSASNNMGQKFHVELAENCPKSFVFVIRECAAIAECSAFNLYRCFQKLEHRLAGLIPNDLAEE